MTWLIKRQYLILWICTRIQISIVLTNQLLPSAMRHCVLLKNWDPNFLNEPCQPTCVCVMLALAATRASKSPCRSAWCKAASLSWLNINSWPSPWANRHRRSPSGPSTSKKTAAKVAFSAAVPPANESEVPDGGLTNGKEARIRRLATCTSWADPSCRPAARKWPQAEVAKTSTELGNTIVCAS